MKHLRKQPLWVTLSAGAIFALWLFLGALSGLAVMTEPYTGRQFADYPTPETGR